jgi:hypothetical protein
MNTATVILVVLGAALLVLVLVAWLKGAFALARRAARAFLHDFGESWTLGAAAEPFLAAAAVFLVAAFGLADPDSRWARWFYGERRMARARARYPAESPQDATVA